MKEGGGNGGRGRDNSHNNRRSVWEGNDPLVGCARDEVTASLKVTQGNEDINNIVFEIRLQFCQDDMSEQLRFCKTF